MCMAARLSTCSSASGGSAPRDARPGAGVAWLLRQAASSTAWAAAWKAGGHKRWLAGLQLPPLARNTSLREEEHGVGQEA